MALYFIKGKTSKESHVALALRKGNVKKWVRNPDYNYISDQRWYIHTEHEGIMALTACGYALEVYGKAYPSATCSYCRGYIDNLKAIEKGGWMTPDEWTAAQA